MTPRLVSFMEIDFFTNPSFHFVSFLVLFTPYFRDKITCFSTYFSFCFREHVFVLFVLVRIVISICHSNFDPYGLLKFGIFSDPPVY